MVTPNEEFVSAGFVQEPNDDRQNCGFFELRVGDGSGVDRASPGGGPAGGCVSVVAPVRSFYRWKGEIESAEEWLLVIKTSRERFDELRMVLEAAHSYEVPEVLAVPVVEGSPNYLAWLEGEVG